MTLIARNLTCDRGGVPVVAGVSFRLEPGDALILRGANGSGKTTLLRTVAGLQRPLAGEIEAPPEGVAYAGHLDGLKATLTAAENLAFWAAIYGTDAAGEALEAFGIAHLADRPAQNLSAGQKRRLGLARLLVTGRRVWVLDEPTVSLDADAVAGFGQVLATHLLRGGAVLAASHVPLGLDAPELDLTRYRAEWSDAGAFA